MGAGVRRGLQGSKVVKISVRFGSRCHHGPQYTGHAQRHHKLDYLPKDLVSGFMVYLTQD